MLFLASATGVFLCELELCDAGVIVTILPPLSVFVFLQEQFNKGFALSSETAVV